MALGSLSWLLVTIGGLYLHYVIFRHIGQRMGVRSKYLGILYMPYNVYRVRELTRKEYFFSLMYLVTFMVFGVLLANL